MRLTITDATFVADGLSLGLLRRWAERAPLFDDPRPRVGTRHAADDGARVPVDR